MPRPRRGEVRVRITPEADFSGLVGDLRQQFRRARREGDDLERGLTDNAKEISSTFKSELSESTRSFRRFSSSAVDSVRGITSNVSDVGRRIDNAIGAPFERLGQTARRSARQVVEPFRNLSRRLNSEFADTERRTVMHLDEIAEGGEDSARKLGRSFDRAGDRIVTGMQGSARRLRGTFGNFFKNIPAQAAVAATAAGAAFATGFSDALNVVNTTSNLTDRLGLSTAEARELSDVVRNIFTSKEVTQGLDEITSSVALVKGEFRELGQADLRSVSRGALKVAEVFDQDLNQVIQATAALVRNGLAKDATEALDLITFGLQQGGARGQDLVDTFQEYSNQFADLGLTGREAILIMNAALEGGARSTDGIADALKESFLLITEGNKGAIESISELGLNYNDIINDINSGNGADVLVDIAVALQGVENTSDRARIAAALLGGTYEQIGLGGLEAIANTRGEIENLDGATERLGQSISKGPLFYLDRLRRIGAVGLAEIFERAQPSIERVGQAVKTVTDAFRLGFTGGDTSELQGRLAGLAEVGERVRAVVDRIREGVQVMVTAFNGEETGQLSQEMQIFADVGRAAADAVEYLSSLFDGFVASLTGQGREGLDGAAQAGYDFTEAMRQLGPVILDVAAFLAMVLPPMVQVAVNTARIVAVVFRAISAFINFANTTQPITNLDNIGAAGQRLIGGFLGVFGTVDRLGPVVSSATRIASGAFIGFRDQSLNAANTVKSGVTNSVNAMVRSVTSLPSRIRGAARNAWDSLYSNFRRVINRIIGGWNRISFSVPSVDLPGIGRVGGQSFRVTQIPRLESGGLLDRETLFIGGEYTGARSNPEIVSPRNAMIDAVMTAIREVGGAGGGPRTQINIENVMVAEGVDLWQQLEETRIAFGA